MSSSSSLTWGISQLLLLRLGGRLSQDARGIGICTCNAKRKKNALPAPKKSGLIWGIKRWELKWPRNLPLENRNLHSMLVWVAAARVIASGIKVKSPASDYQPVGRRLLLFPDATGSG